MTDKSKVMCEGCRDDFYNARGGCWAYEKASVVRRFKIGWWTMPLDPGAFEEVETLDCHHAPGKYALHKEPHRDAVAIKRLPMVRA